MSNSKRLAMEGGNRTCLGEKVVSEKEYRSAMAGRSDDLVRSGTEGGRVKL